MRRHTLFWQNYHSHTLLLLLCAPLFAAANGWRRDDHADLMNGLNIYNPHVLRAPHESVFRMYFMGWAATRCNAGYAGCDAIFTARSLPGAGMEAWEVYSGTDSSGRDAWDRSNNSSLWVPVVTAADKP